jgi:hypothetical protein
MMSEKRKEFYHYMFTTAIEGGTDSWAGCVDYSWSKKYDNPDDELPARHVDDLDGFYAVMYSTEDDWGVEKAFVSEVGEDIPITEDQLLRVDLDVMVRGWKLFMEKVLSAFESEDPSADFSNPYYRQAVVQYLTNMEDGDSDADVADVVVQLGLFGERVYS